METTQISVNVMDKENVVCIFNGILFGHEKEYNLASGIYKRCSTCGKMELVEEKND